MKLKILTGALAVAGLAFSTCSIAGEQLVYSDTGLSVAAGTKVTVPVYYETANPVDETLTGVGVKLYFDDSVLTFDGFTIAHSGDLLSADSSASADAADEDSDPLTTAKAGVAYMSMSSQFPGAGKTPVKLFDAVFTATSEIDDPSMVNGTVINLERSGSASGYTFVGTPVTVLPNQCPEITFESGYEHIVAEATGEFTDVNLGQTTANDPEEGAVTPTANKSGPFSVGTHEVEWTATDSQGASCIAIQTVDIELYQKVTPAKAEVKKPVGKTFALTPIYDVTLGKATLNGLGLRIHYNSSKLNWEGFEDIFASSLIASDTTPQVDANDDDDDAATDMYLAVAWAAMSTDWPGSLPTTLYNANFSWVAGLADGETTTVNFSSTNTAPGYGFASESVQLEVGPDANWDIDGNGVADALTDGILLIRYLFGFSGSTLVNGATAPDAIRTTEEIAAYLGEMVADGISDIDGNGASDALTDGILLIRYAFGFTGETLISGALATDAARNTATDIEAYIAEYMPE